MKLQFSKMHGLGNDFMVVDAVRQHFIPTPELVRQLADRQQGIGFDQLLIVAPATQADIDFSYRIFNADGSEVAQCGNGARCIARFIQRQHLSEKPVLRIQTSASILELQLELGSTDLVHVNMGIPQFTPAQIPCLASQAELRYQLNGIEFGAVSLGNPHAVLWIDDITTAPVTEIGQYLQNKDFFPESVNVGFMQVIQPNFIKLRVYERGAGETKACGSAACAAAVIGNQWQLLGSEVTVALPGGELIIHWLGTNQPIWMTGPATHVFDGSFEA